MRWLWFCGGHVNSFNFAGGGFGFGLQPSVCVVARLELVVALCWPWVVVGVGRE